VLTLGSHFDGIAGFPLAAAGNGIEVVWATEIEPFPIVVSKAHFPHMKHYGSITDVSGAELEPVDIITFGSPCQDLSIAGKRAGLEGERSGLFMEAVRTIREMRDATSGVYPRIAVWENVPGSMSSNNGADFRAVLEEILEAEVPVPRSGKWASAGMVRGNGREIAWRILDAQYWGVPQRRRRIFLVCDFRGECAGEILFERQGVPWNPAESREAGQETTGGVGDGAKTAGRYWDGGAVSDCLDCSVLAKRQTMPEKRRMAAVLEPTFAFSAGQSDKARTLGFHEEVSPTLRAGASGTNMTPTIMEPKAFAVNQRDEARDLGDKSGALQAQPGMKQQTFVIQNATRGKGQNGLGISGEDVSFTLNTIDRHAVAHTVDCRNLCENRDLSGTLQCKSNGGHSLNYQNPVRVGYRVRRLTPTECTRLQGFPDDWLEVQSYGNADEEHAREVLHGLWREVGAKAREGRRFRIAISLLTPEILLAGVYGGWISWEMANRSAASAREIQGPDAWPEGFMCALWQCQKTGQTPHRRESFKQLAGELGRPLQELPLEGPQARAYLLNSGMWTEASKEWPLRYARSEKEARQVSTMSDTARYKALGNSVAIPCVRWIMRRIKEQIEELQDEGQA